MDQDAKMKILEELDCKTDWSALIMERQKLKLDKPVNQTKQHNSNRKLTKSEKKKMKLKKQMLEVQETLKRKKVETIVFNNPDALSTKTSKLSGNMGVEETDKNLPAVQEGIDVDLKEARYEIMKFGMSSLSSQELADAESALAISLGAKAPKRPAVNYKELQLQRKKEREAAKEQAASWTKPKLKTSTKKKTGARKGMTSKDKKQSTGRGGTNRNSSDERNSNRRQRK